IGMPRRTISTLFRARSRHNTLLVTEQCNHYCLMCSQPPKRGSDRWLVEDAQEVVRMLPSSVESLGISGGEPTLLGDDLIELLRLTRSHLPNTSVDLLSNGRRFSDHGFCRSYAAIGHSRLTVGIPLYSDDPARHDYVVQAKGAFDETVRGILNLKRYRQRVEVRVVLHAQTTPRLVETAHFIARNLLFVDHVALMGLEMTGFTLANLDTLWIDPYDYQRKLGEAVDILQSAGMLVSIYNLPLCVIPTSASSAYRKSISDWKNEYVAACEPCARKSDCGGFFSSAVKTRLSSHILPFQ
ncbi:MAG: His-Xaa-Ser system radical SAM maturase HxsC, partial [Burkholderiales bacterium]|nr:His-Xaa-Ser system radical SAM maturase HxsC [Burkholderiales bacterium]